MQNLLYGPGLPGGGIELAAEIDVRSFKEVDIEGGTIVAAIPSVGMVSTIASTYLISALRMDQVCALDSEDFPPLSMIYGHKPKFPARVYASLDHKVAVFICEVPLPLRVHRPLARTLLEWGRKARTRLILPLEGLPSREEEPAGRTDLWGVGSTDAARALLDSHKIPQLETGIIPGVSGVLLNEGRWRRVDVVSLLVAARPALPDAMAAARLVEGVDRLLPEMEIDMGPLQRQAKSLEDHLQKLKDQAKPALVEEAAKMYR
jgi:predicted ATP-grasp superfamily ATP-dependent carboligase